jgi:hypothetical protein
VYRIFVPAPELSPFRIMLPMIKASLPGFGSVFDRDAADLEVATRS